MSRRLATDWPVLAAVGLTVLVGMVQLASAPIYTEAVAVGALRRVLADAPTADATVVVGVRTSSDFYPDTDQVVTGALGKATATTGATVTRRIESTSFELPGRRSGDKVDLVIMASVEGIKQHTTLTAGSWPTDGDGNATAVPAAPETRSSGRLSAALEAGVADRLGLELGQVLELASRADGSTAVVEIVGLYRINDGNERFWADDELLLNGIVDGPSFRTFGPLVVSRPSILGGHAGRLQAQWLAEPHLERVVVDDVDRLRRSLDALPTALEVGLADSPASSSGAVSDAEVSTRLPDLLLETSRSLTVTRSGVFAVALQLAVLSGMALIVSGRLLVDTRRRESDLFEARGAGRLELLALSVAEALLVVVPAVLAGPWIAVWLVERLEAVGPLAAIELDLEPTVSGASSATVAIVGVVMVFLLAWPRLRPTAGVISPMTRHRRQGRRPVVQRVGVDVALVVLTGLAFWQLRALGSQRASLIGDRLSVDPVLVMAPALALLTGAVVTLRFVPLLARVAERQVARGRSLIATLTGWQLARRPGGQTRSVFLLVMAISIGFFASAHGATWSESQKDQATFQIGADVRLTPNRRTNDSITDLHLVAAHEALDGVAASMPVVRLSGALTGSERPGQFIILDATRADDVVRIRPDLAPDFDRLMDVLEQARPELPGIALPADTDRLELLIVAEEEEIKVLVIDDEEEEEQQQQQQQQQTDDQEGAVDEVEVDEGAVDEGEIDDDEAEPEYELLPLGFAGQVVVVIQDGNGMLHRVDLGDVAPNVGPQMLVAELTTSLGDGTSARPAHPLSIVDVEIRSPVPEPPSRTVRLGLLGLSAKSGSAGSVEVPLLDVSFGGVPSGDPAGRWVSVTGQAAGLAAPQAIATEPLTDDGAIRFAIGTGSSFDPSSRVIYSLRPGEALAADHFPVVVAQPWLEASRSEVGDVVPFPALPFRRVEGQIVGAIDAFPTVDPASGPVMLIDLATVQMMDHGLGRPILTVEENWLELESGADPDTVMARLEALPYDSFRTEGRDRRQAALTTDPAALATIGAFTIGFVAAAVFAVVVFTMTAVMSARERSGEFTLLRALGLSPRQFGLWMAAEQFLLLAISLLLGTTIGAALSALVLPLVAVGQQGETVVPSVEPVYPWATVAAVELAPIAVLLVIVVVMAQRLRRQSLASQLRVGED